MNWTKAERKLSGPQPADRFLPQSGGYAMSETVVLNERLFWVKMPVTARRPDGILCFGIKACERKDTMPIKLIAADMDGTLLDSQKRLPVGLDALIHALYAQGVRFAPASGRQYYTLYEQFRDSFGAVADELIYISENGAMVCDGAKLLSFDAMPADEVCRAVEAVRRMPGVYTIVSAQDGGVYEQGDDAAFQENIALYCTRRRPVPDLLEFVRHEPVCKVALFCAGRAEQVLLPAFADFSETSQVALSGADWVDLMRPGMNKGGALGALCTRLGISPDDCMAFGDYLNDLELLQAAGESYAMENGHETLKAAAKYICPSNDDDGVCRTIRRVFGIDKR